jgi:phenylpyruvate tautomerase PptA (4-oxalocrotonate tautomerase family)
MPVYTLTTEENALTQEQKKALASKIADIHTATTGAPRKFVRVFYHTYAKGNAYVGDEIAPSAILQCQIRAGRPLEKAQKIIRECSAAINSICKIDTDALTTLLEEVPPHFALEFGDILPDTTHEAEQAWLKAHGK